MENINTFDHISWIEHSNAMCRLAQYRYPNIKNWILTPTLLQNKDYTIVLQANYNRDNTPVCRSITFTSIGDSNSLWDTLEAYPHEREEVLTVTIEKIGYSMKELEKFYQA